MFLKIAYTTAVVTLILTLFQNVNAIDLESAKEGSCLDIKETVSVDLNWAMSQKVWYYPLMSRFDIYHVSSDMTGKNPKDIREDEIYYSSCIHFTFAGNKFHAKGFGNRRLSYSMNPVKGLEEFEFTTDLEGSNMKGGKCYTTLTDNKTYMVNACCTSGSQRTWAVSSTIKQLPEKTSKLIYDHVESLGFKREYFTGLRYDSCKEDFDKEEPVKNEL